MSIDCPRTLALFDRRSADLRLKARQPGGLSPASAASAASLLAVALLRLGDAAGIPLLIDTLAAENQRSSTTAGYTHRTLQLYAQQDLPYTPTAAADVRQAQIEQWRAWWRMAQPTFVVPLRAAAIDEDCCWSDVIVPIARPYRTDPRVSRLASGVPLANEIGLP
jgi:hypothetical protein